MCGQVIGVYVIPIIINLEQLNVKIIVEILWLIQIVVIKQNLLEYINAHNLDQLYQLLKNI